MTVLLEVCVDDPAGLAAAVAGGADRIELCSSLELGGLTPTPGLIEQAARVSTPVYAMVRPRAGNFIYSDIELGAMLHDIAGIRSAGLAGVVFGANLANGALDERALRRLMAEATGLGVTLHRAFDLVPDVAEAVETAVELKFERILTSGRMPTALEGMADLEATHDCAAGRIAIMPGSGVNLRTAQKLLEHLAFGEIHSSCSVAATIVNEPAARLGFETASRKRTDADLVRELKAYLLNS
ncbi:copper homeostasis protein CutC [Phyllobacterium sp. 21LDTY02-6]|uniref:copper homeostasis protein CutC n=1 Tax=Phyllobacterium sp. 21LDTY02-6 TaxID=2944903 RepID=UPI002021B971|nr:copper homeostasis protein CutC [Phyllobacterium sp. 21LDTY02-6]MCO4316076.1 copper homeostasis protein CutC [Phyllobacterium sp. 21LDTY02-6]